ncbi:MAG: helix-turn-helix transcriptional regulator [Bernardetiaceae bacterium]
MPATKLAFFRYMLIDRMLRDKRRKYPSKKDMLEVMEYEYGVRSVSTIEKDIQAMRDELEAPIRYCKRMRGYHYTDPEYRLLGTNLSESEQQAIGFVEGLLQEFRDWPIFSTFSDAVDKVLDGITITKAHDKNATRRKVWMEMSPYVKGGNHMQELMVYTNQDRVIEIRYQKHQHTHQKTYTLHPYLLRSYNNLWYIIGATEESQYGIRTFGLDRILDILPTDIPFVQPEQIPFDPDVYFAHALGITVYQDQSPMRIQLRFSQLMSDYITANPIHPSQRVLSSDASGTLIELFVIVNPELKRVILSYGKEVSVIAPQALTDWISEELDEWTSIYQEKQTPPC